MQKLRHKISKTHVAITFGGGYRLLGDDEELINGDETACVSTLLSLINNEPWIPVFAVGKTVKATCDDPMTQGGNDVDLDGGERIFRRRV